MEMLPTLAPTMQIVAQRNQFPQLFRLHRGRGSKSPRCSFLSTHTLSPHRKTTTTTIMREHPPMHTLAMLLIVIWTASTPWCLAIWLPRPVGGQLDQVVLQDSDASLQKPPFWGNEQPDWAQYAPYVPVEEYEDVPEECTITQVNLLQRHGARFPTSGSATKIQEALAKVQAVQTWNDPKLDFIPTYVYDLGEEDLVPLGALQSQQSGRVQYERYQHLFSEDDIPFVRASSGERVVLSSQNWTSGFAQASSQKLKPVLSVILNEAANNTLDDAMCPNAGDSSTEKDKWESTFAPSVRKRLNKLAGGQDLGLTNGQIPHLISLCAFDSVAKEKLSPWCGVFEPSEVAAFEYWGDLDKYYGTGYGQPLGPVQGVGYINELLARLTGTPVKDATQTNSTLDSSPVTFPLDRSMYADFSHDNEMIAIYSAMGLFHVKALNPTGPKHNSQSAEKKQDWVVRKMVPFSARMVVERMRCSSGISQRSSTQLSNDPGVQTGKDYVRVLVNDKIMPLEFCKGVRADGLCALDKFVKSQKYARSDGDGDWEKCSSVD